MVTGLLIFARSAGFLFRAPGFSHPSVPPTVRAALAVALAAAIAKAMHAVPPPAGAGLVAAFASEFLIGAVMGSAASIAYDGAYAGGRIVDDYVGVKAIAPSVALVAPSGFGRVWSLAFTGAFFLSGLYRGAIFAFARSFEPLPPGTALAAPALMQYAVHLAAAIAYVAVQVAAPAVALAFTAQVALGAISRVVPRFGSFTLAFPLAYAAALIATAVAMPLLAQRLPSPAPLLP